MLMMRSSLAKIPMTVPKLAFASEACGCGAAARTCSHALVRTESSDGRQACPPRGRCACMPALRCLFIAARPWAVSLTKKLAAEGSLMVFFDDEDEGQGLFSLGATANAYKFAMAARTIAKQAKQANEAMNAMNHPVGHGTTSPSGRRRSRRGSAAKGAAKLKTAVHALKLVSQTNTFTLFAAPHSHRSSSAGSLQRSSTAGASTGNGADASAELHVEGHAKDAGFNASENGTSTPKVSFSSSFVIDPGESSASVYSHEPPPTPKVNMKGEGARNVAFAQTDEAVGIAQASHTPPKVRERSRKRFAGLPPPAPSKRATQTDVSTAFIDAAITHAASARKTRTYNKQTTLGRIMRTAWKQEEGKNGDDASGGSGGGSSNSSGGDSSNRSGGGGGSSSDRASAEEESSKSKRRRWKITGKLMSPFRSRRTSTSSAESSASSGRRTDLDVAIDTTSATMEPPPPPPLQVLDSQKEEKKLKQVALNQDEFDVDDEPTLPPGVVSVDRNTRGFGTLNLQARERPKLGHHDVHAYESLVFKGGGAKGSIYPGAVQALEDVGVMPYIKRFAGASAGAVVAALLASGLSAKQLFRELANTDLFGLIKDGDSAGAQLYTLVTKCGMNPGNALYRYLGLLFYKYLGNADVTFRQLYEAFGVELAICVTNVTRASSELLHVKT